MIYATGFRTTEFMFPMEITGRDGLTLSERGPMVRTPISGSRCPDSRRCS